MNSNSVTGKKKYLLGFGDLIILYFSLLLTLLIRFGQNFNSDLWAQHLIPFSIIFTIFIAVFYIDDLYEINFGYSKYSLFGRIVKNTIIATIVAVVFFYIGQDRLFTIRPQRVLFINSAIFTLLSFGWHIVFTAIMKTAKITNNILIIGNNDLVKEINRDLTNKPELGLTIKKIIENTDEHSITNLKNICQQEKINTVVSTIHPRENEKLSKNLFECLPLKINFYDIATFYEKITGKVPVTTIQQVWFLENLSGKNKNLYEIGKRFFETAVSITLLILFIPFFPFIALAIKLNSAGPLLFKQDRVGKDGKIFKTVKFRSMIADAEKNGAVWASKNDNRVTSIGKFIRKTRIDEIPQLLNVIMGQTSLIGPRPERPQFVEQLVNEIPFYKERLIVKPGVTGWAQVMGPAYGGSKKESLEKLQYDLYYIKNRSLALDLSITLKTIKTVLSRKGQ